MDKRSFLKNAGLLGLGSMIEPGSLAKLIASVAEVPSAELAENEDFWRQVRAGYLLNPDYINLENGYYCFLPLKTLESFIKHVREINYQGSYYMRTVQFENKKAIAARYGVVNKVVSVPNHPESDTEIVNLYANAITEKTRLLMVCHMINITGQILPVREICDMAHSKGVQVMVAGAHAFGHFRL